MAKALLAWELGGGAGHCVDLALVAKGLVDHGHDVCVALRDLTAARPLFATLAVEYFQAPFLVGNPKRPNLWPQTMAQILQNVGFGDADDLDVLVRAWRSVFAAVRPDAVVFDHSPTALLASCWFDHRRFIIARGFELPPRRVAVPRPLCQQLSTDGPHDTLREPCDRVRGADTNTLDDAPLPLPDLEYWRDE
jgi:hypothetical protein